MGNDFLKEIQSNTLVYGSFVYHKDDIHGENARKRT